MYKCTLSFNFLVLWGSSIRGWLQLIMIVTNIHIAQTHLFAHFYHFQIDFAHIADRWIDATEPLDLNSWLVLLMHKSKVFLAHALNFYWLLRLYIHGFAVLHLPRV